MADDCTVVKFSNESHSAHIETLKNNDNGDKMSDVVPEFGLFYVICISLSIITYVLDYILACWLLYYYSINGNGVYFALTLTFVVLPAILMTAFSMRWYIVDHDDPSLGKPSVGKWVLRIILLLLQLAPLLRYCDALSYGLRSKAAGCAGNRQRQSKLYRRMLDEDSNGALLRLFHCFLHAAPQCIIQLMILLNSVSQNKINESKKDVAVLQMWATLCGVVSIAWSITTYHRSVRYARDDKEKMSWVATVIAFCWHLTSAVSRVLALSLLASVRPVWFGAVGLLHWAVMGAWLALGQAQTAVCTSRCEELLLSTALGLAYVLAFIAPRDGPTRYSYLAYYLVCFMENTAALVVWCVTFNSSGQPSLYYGSVILQVCTFLLSLVFMCLYYRWFHPSAPRGKSLVLSTGGAGPSTSHVPKHHHAASVGSAQEYSKAFSHS